MIRPALRRFSVHFSSGATRLDLPGGRSTYQATVTAWILSEASQQEARGVEKCEN
jgi:hypothetical protein